MKKMCLFLLIFILITISSQTLADIHLYQFDFYEMFNEHGSNMLLIDSQTGDIEYANQSAADFYGYNKEELESMKISDINTLASEETALRMQAAVREKRNYFTFEHRTAGGEVKTVEVYSYPYTFNGKEMLFSIIHDITSETRLEERNKKMTQAIYIGAAVIIIILLLFSTLLLKNIKKLKVRNKEINNFNELRKSFINADERLIYLKDENLKYIFVNTAMEKFYNNDASEIVGHDDYDLTGREFAEIRRRTDKKVLEQKSRHVEEVQWENRIYKTNKFPIKLLNGRYGVGAYIEDVTERYQREREKEKANQALQENKEKLQLILNSTAEGIFGINNEGRCTFCNKSALEMLGYSGQNDLLGKTIHSKIHHSYKNGTSMQLDECKIYSALLKGNRAHADNEAFWRSDGSSFDVEYFAYPQYKNGEIVGAVVTFINITERKKDEAYIRYLSYHDSLTGLYNRMFFEDELKRLDVKTNLPISIIFGDVNGLKLTNDIFGHDAGDELLKKSAEILQEVCREEDIIARVGGDEFAILLCNTEGKDAEGIINRIKEKFAQKEISVVKGSMALGFDTKKSTVQDIRRVMNNAEEDMYKEKTLNREKVKKNMINTIMDTIHDRDYRGETHSNNVSKLSKKIAEAMKLPETEIRKVKEAGFLHDIGKIVFDKQMININTEELLSEEEKKEFNQHPVLGYRILNLFDETMELAEAVLHHHENWDGSGYPKGIEGEEIPVSARIIRVAQEYDVLTNSLARDSVGKEKALEIIKEQSGTKLDPKIVDVFLDIMQAGLKG